jgi:hypothetical protein
MQERIKAFRDIAAALRTRAQGVRGGIAVALTDASADLEKHADGMAADVATEHPSTDEREKRARELYERVGKRHRAALEQQVWRWDNLPEERRLFWLTLVDVIGEIEEIEKMAAQPLMEAEVIATHAEILAGDSRPTIATHEIRRDGDSAIVAEQWTDAAANRVVKRYEVRLGFSQLVHLALNTTAKERSAIDGRADWRGVSIGQALVQHDDGTEAPYDADELRPEPQK